MYRQSPTDFVYFLGVRSTQGLQEDSSFVIGHFVPLPNNSTLRFVADAIASVTKRYLLGSIGFGELDFSDPTYTSRQAKSSNQPN
jgi:hypothetical protein